MKLSKDAKKALIVIGVLAVLTILVSYLTYSASSYAYLRPYDTDPIPDGECRQNCMSAVSRDYGIVYTNVYNPNSMCLRDVQL